MSERVIDYKGTKCALEIRFYANNRVALQLIEMEYGEVFTVATVNVPEIRLEKDEVIIRNHSENEGMAEALAKAGIVKTTGKSVEIGYVTAPICKLLIDIGKDE